MKSVIAFMTILDGKTVRCISSLGSLARLYSCAFVGMEKAACFGQIWRPPRESDNIYKISVSLFYHLRIHRVLPRNPPLLFLPPSRGTGTSAIAIQTTEILTHVLP
ncbi:hypothetical protein P5V15_006768 [Pogonomyrmex californicus]